MSINFPEYADLGMDTSVQQMHTWDAEIARLQQYWHYYSGDVLKEIVDTEIPNDKDAPLVFPVGMNLVKMMCLAQADITYGEWEDLPVQYGVRLDQEIEEDDKKAADLAHAILDGSDAATLLWEVDLDREIFGGGAIKISPNLGFYPYIKWSRIPRECFFPIWNPNDVDDLLEVYIRIAMTADQARALYGYETSKDIVFRVEHWTKSRYENFLDGKRLTEYHGVNPWGVVPFVYLPRFRSGNWFGDSLTSDLIPVQDEMNMRVADIGDAINYNAHPTRWGVNLPRDFNADNYPLGPNSFWNLGRFIGSSPEPKVGILEASQAVQPGVFQHLEFVYDWARVSSFAPPIAFGEDKGSQRSGDTLEIRMWSLLRSTRRNRAYLSKGLKRALYISGKILAQKKFSDIPVRPVDHILERRLVPKFYNVLPRDQQKAVDEVVKLSSTDPRMISTQTAQEVLGRSPGEVERIKEENKDKELWMDPVKEEAAKAGQQIQANKGVGDTKKTTQQRSE